MKSDWTPYLAAAAAMLREPASGAEIKLLAELFR